MKITNKIHKFTVLLISSILVFGIWITMSASANEEEKNIEVVFSSKVAEDFKTSMLTIDCKPSQKVERITKVVAPDTTELDPTKEMKYEIQENGEYRFKVYYILLEESKEEKEALVEVEKVQEEVYVENNILVNTKEKRQTNLLTQEPITTYAVTSVTINSDTFPDEIFRNWVLANITSGSTTLTDSMIANTQTINVSNLGINSLIGIEYFTNLTELNCSKNKLSQLDISKNILLTKVDASENKLSKLDINNNPELIDVNLRHNQFLSFIYDYTVVTKLELKNLQLTSQELSIKVVKKNGRWESVDTYDYRSNSLGEFTYDKNTKKFICDKISSISSTSFILSVSNATSGMGYDDTKATFIADTYFQPVANLVEVPSIVKVGIETELSGTIVPNYADKKEVVWSVKEENGTGASITGNKITTTNSGEFTILATITDGALTSDYTKEFKILSVLPTETRNRVTFHTDAILTTPQISTQLLSSGEKIVKPDTPARKGYEFTGWYTDSNCTQLWDFNNTIKSNIVLYAGWKSIGEGDIVIDEKHFPDANFRMWLKNYLPVGTDGILTPEEIASTTTINCSYMGISDLTGIEIFTELIQLKCSGLYSISGTASSGSRPSLTNSIADLDLSNNKKLEILSCGGNKLTSLDISNQPNLRQLSCGGNELSELDIDHNLELVYLEFDGNKVSSIDISKHHKIKTIYFSGNQLTQLDLTTYKGYPDFYYGYYQQKIPVPMVEYNGSWISTKTYEFNNNTNFRTEASTADFNYNETTKRFEMSSSAITQEKSRDFVSKYIPDYSIENSNYFLFGKLDFEPITYQAVTNITDVVNEITVGKTVRLKGRVEPDTAAFKEISWSVKNSNGTGANIENGVLTTTAPGSFVITATIENGINGGNYTKDFTIISKNPKNYTITFNSNGGSAIENKTVVENSVVSQPINPSKTGNTFVSWYKDATLANKWDFANDTVTEDTTLYAEWDTNVYTATFEGSGTITKYYGEALGTLPTTSKDHYQFIGWYDAKTGGNKITENTTMPGANTTYYPRMEAVEYDITYSLDGGENNSSNPVTYTIENETFSLLAPSKQGYTFTGWSGTDITGTSKSVTISKGSVGSRSYTAHWTINSYGVEFDSLGGSAIAPMSITYNNKITKPSDPTKDGYSFVGWYKEAACTNAWNFENDVVTEATTLYAKWNVNQYTASFDGNGGSDGTSITTNYNSKLGTLPTSSKQGYTFVGWYDAKTGGNKITENTTMPSSNVTYYAKWTVNQYTASFDGNGGSNGKSITTDYNSKLGTLPTSSKEGYSFVGWYDAKTGGNKITENTTMPSKNVTYYAKWTVNSYNITFGNTTIEKEYDTEFGTLPDANKDGYEFEGWYDSEIGGNKITETSKVPAEDTIYYPHWKRKEYTITYNLDGGVNHRNNPTTYTIESNDIHLLAPTKTGYTFTGWSTNQSTPSKEITIAKGSMGNKEYVANWQINRYTVTYQSNGGSIVESKTVNYHSIVQQPVQPNRKDYSFEGWYKEESLTTLWDFEKDVVVEDITLYAKWKEMEAVSNVTSDTPEGEIPIGSSITLQTDTKGADIYYTTDGSKPSKDSHRYTNPLVIDKDMTIQAIAFKEGMKDSEVITLVYKIKEYGKVEVKVEGKKIEVQTSNKEDILVATLNEED